MAATLALSTAAISPALAADSYPSWDDVVKAQKSEKATKALVKKIQAQIASLKRQVEETQKEAKEKGDLYAAAQNAADQQAFIADQLQGQADAAQKEADAAKESARELIAQLAQTGNTDVTAALLAGAGSSESLLYRLGATSTLGDRFAGVYEHAVQLQNTADGLAAQAKDAADKREELAKIAQDAYQVAKEAADRVAAKLTQQLEQQQKLEAQLEALIAKRKMTEKQYLAGIAAAWGSGAAGHISADGYALPAVGYISSPFGMRVNPYSGVYGLHTGVDIAGGGYNAPIRAAHAGTVIYAGWYGDLGNFIKIDHGNGVVTGYGHINYGGIGVHVGQNVAPGQVIAKVGATGGATGPHLHFMTYVNGTLTDPVPFMRKHGIRIGG